MTNTKKNEIIKYLHTQKIFGYKYIEELNFDDKSSCDFSLPSDLDELRKVVNSCHLCELSKSRKNVLFSYGNIDSKIMIICDEPTKSEDELGTFYSGNSGEMLSNMITNVLMLKKEDVYLTNLVKCRSKTGANVSNFDSCSCYLYKQIDIVKPKIILAFGQSVFNYLIKDEGDFLQRRGDVIKYQDSHFIATYSTQYLLKNPSLKKDTLEDLKTVKRVYKEIK